VLIVIDNDYQLEGILAELKRACQVNLIKSIGSVGYIFSRQNIHRISIKSSYHGELMVVCGGSI
jgi:hypothetical protein